MFESTQTAKYTLFPYYDTCFLIKGLYNGA